MAGGAGCLVLLSAAAAGVDPRLGGILFTVTVCGAALAWLPRHWLPAMALAAFVLIPVKWLPLPDVLSTLSPGALVLGAWSMRLLHDKSVLTGHISHKADAWLVGTGIMTAAWLGATTLTSEAPAVSLGWSVSFVLCVVVPVLLASHERSAGDIVIRTMGVLLGVIGTFAVVETWVLADNPVFAAFYADAGPDDSFTQQWSVYRATTSLGHPLVNGAFFCVAMPVTIGHYLRTGQSRWLVAVLLGGLGTMATGARGGAIAAVAGVAVTAAVHVRRTGLHSTAARIAAVTAPAAAAVAVVVVLSQRATSDEGPASFAYRLAILEPGLAMALQSPVFGTGPGTGAYLKSQATTLFAGLPTAESIPDLSFENSWLELLIGAGPLGLLLVVAILLLAGWKALAGHHHGVVGGLVGWIIVAGTFNLLDGHRPAHVLLGSLIFAAVANRGRSENSMGTDRSTAGYDRADGRLALPIASGPPASDRPTATRFRDGEP